MLVDLRFLLFLPLILLANSKCSQSDILLYDAGGIDHRGLTMVAPPRPFESNPMPAVSSIAANSIAVVPYAFSRIGQTEVHYNQSQHQWWGERPAGVIETIDLAHQAGIQVLLKPQVYVPGSWTGHLAFDNPELWQQWEDSYLKYILQFAHIADSMGVNSLCVGTEFKLSVEQRPEFWRTLIAKVRTIYQGQVTYAANWDDFQDVPFWDMLDYIGINAYFPLKEIATPPVSELVDAWNQHLPLIEAVSSQQQKAVVFTEYGYLSVDHCAYQTWELEKNIEARPINEQAQANALTALYTVFSQKPYWAGGYLWKWFPNGAGHEGYKERDYTPQGKLAEEVIKQWYTSF